MLFRNSAKVQAESAHIVEANFEERQLTETVHTALPHYISTLMPRSDIWPLFKGLKQNSLVTAVLTVLIFCLSYLENELFYANKYTSNLQVSFLRTLIMLLCFAQTILVYRFYIGIMVMRIAYCELDKRSKD
jgi:hypothetical protein